MVILLTASSSLRRWASPRLWSQFSCSGSTWWLMACLPPPWASTPQILTSWRSLLVMRKNPSSPAGSSSDTWPLGVGYNGKLKSAFMQLNKWVICVCWCYLVSLLVGYVGAATVGAAAWWFTVSEDGPQLTLYQLVSLPVWVIILQLHPSALCLPLTPLPPCPTEPLPPVRPRQPRFRWPGLPRVWVTLPHDHGPVSPSHHRDVQCSQQVNISALIRG